MANVAINVEVRSNGEIVLGKLGQGFDVLGQKGEKAKTQMQQFMDSLGKGVGIGAGFSAATFAADALIGAVRGLGREMVASAQWAEDLGKAIRVTGLQSKAFQQLESSATDLGFAGSDITNMMVRLNKAVLSSDPALKSLGLSLTQLRDASPEERLQAAAGALVNVGDSARQTTLGVELFGRSGAELLPLLDQIASRAYTANAALGDGTVAALDRADRAIDKFNSKWSKFKHAAAGKAAETADFIWGSFEAIFTGAPGAGPTGATVQYPGGMSAAEWKRFNDPNRFLDTSELDTGGETPAQREAVAVYKQAQAEALRTQKETKELIAKAMQAAREGAYNQLKRIEADELKSYQYRLEQTAKYWQTVAKIENEGRGLMADETDKYIKDQMGKVQARVSADMEAKTEQIIQGRSGKLMGAVEWKAYNEQIDRSIERFSHLADLFERLREGLVQMGAAANSFAVQLTGGLAAGAAAAVALKQAIKTNDKTGQAAAIAGGATAAYGSGSFVGGAATGAMTGAAFGPWGAVIGGAVGGILGIFGGKAKRKAEEKARRDEELKQMDQMTKSLVDQYGSLDQADVIAHRYGISLKEALDTKNPKLLEQALEAVSKKMKGLEVAAAGLKLMMDSLTYTDAKGKILDTFTDPETLGAVARSFSSTFWEVWRKQGASAALELRPQFEKLLDVLARQGIDPVKLGLGRVGQLMDVTKDPKTAALLGVSQGAGQMLRGMMDAGYVDKGLLADQTTIARQTLAQLKGQGLDDTLAAQATADQLAALAQGYKATGQELPPDIAAALAAAGIEVLPTQTEILKESRDYLKIIAGREGYAAGGVGDFDPRGEWYPLHGREYIIPEADYRAMRRADFMRGRRVGVGGLTVNYHASPGKAPRTEADEIRSLRRALRTDPAVRRLVPSAKGYS